MTDTNQIIAGLSQLVDAGRVLTDADSLQHYGCDWTKKYDPAPLAIVLPKTVEQVQAIVRFANEHQVVCVFLDTIRKCPEQSFLRTTVLQDSL